MPAAPFAAQQDAAPAPNQPSSVSRFLTRPYCSSLTALGVSASALAAFHLVDPLGLVPTDARHIAAAAAATNMLWCGANSSITGMEAWVKFHAPSLPRGAAIDVGRHVFSALNKAEIGLASATVYLWLVDRSGGLLSATVADAGDAVFAGTASWLHLLPPAMVALQSVWLGPTLMRRALLIAEAGINPPPSTMHMWYTTSEAVKLVALLASARYCLGYLL